MRYSIHTSAILDGWRRHYPPDVFPPVWAKLDELIASGDLMATEEVFHELEKRDDEVYAWVRERKHMFAPIDGDIQLRVAQILGDYPKLLDTRRGRSGADPFVIAFALMEGRTVVTGEKPTGSPDRPNIPDVCSGLGVSAISLLDLFRQQRWVFHKMHRDA